MEVIKGKVLSVQGENKAENEKVIEYFTAPEPVRKGKYSFFLPVAVQVVLVLAAAAFIHFAGGSGGELGEAVKEITGRIING